jgi:hypothetical protein
MAGSVPGLREEVLADREAADEIGRRSRRLAENEFALDSCANRFETILSSARLGTLSQGQRMYMGIDALHGTARHGDNAQVIRTPTAHRSL